MMVLEVVPGGEVRTGQAGLAARGVTAEDRTRFAVDQPSTVLGGFAGPAASKLGAELDRQLAGLLNALGISWRNV
jgi:hypothetical protein